MKSLKLNTNSIYYSAFFALFICLGLAQSVQAQALDNSEIYSEMSFDSAEIDYGVIAQNSSGDKVFKFTNTGNAPLIISKVKTSCGCTVANYPKKPILPGESGEISVAYDTKRIGAFTKTITVLSNASEPQLKLKIKGEILKGSI